MVINFRNDFSIKSAPNSLKYSRKTIRLATTLYILKPLASWLFFTRITSFVLITISCNTAWMSVFHNRMQTNVRSTFQEHLSWHTFVTIKCIFVKIKSTKNTVLFPPLGKQLCFCIEERPKFVVVKLYYMIIIYVLTFSHKPICVLKGSIRMH